MDEGLLAEFDHGRTADAESTDQVPDKATAPCPRDLIRDDHLMEEVPLLGAYASDPVLGHFGGILVETHQASEVASFPHLLVYRVGYFLGILPFTHVGFYLGLHPFADLGTEGGVRQVEVR